MKKTQEIIFNSANTKNKLVYDNKKHMYVHYHGRHKVWEMEGDEVFLNYIKSVVEGNGIIDEHYANQFKVWVKYISTCRELHKEESK